MDAAEVRDGKTAGTRKWSIETRAPPAKAACRVCRKLELVVARVAGSPELPMIELREAA
jgi:hypothetical protein